MKNLRQDFRSFLKSRGGSTSVFDKMANKMNNMLTPYILEERQLNVATFDVFSRLMYDRIIYLSGQVSRETCDIIIAQLLYLTSVDSRPINMYINSEGGSVVDGLGVIDTMNYISCDVYTTCVGLAASMAAVLLSNGKKGNRFVLPHSRVMIHSVSSGMEGHTADMEISFAQTKRCQEDVYAILAKNTNHDVKEIEDMCNRDKWFIGTEAIDFGIADNILEKK